MKKPLVIVAAVVLLILSILAALPFVIDVNRFKPTLETDLSSVLGRKVQIGNIGLSLFSGSVELEDVSLADDPAFGSAPFLQAKRLAAGVAIEPLIFSKKLKVSSFTITDPKVVLLRNPSGIWNFSNLGSGAKSAKIGNSSSGNTDFSAHKISIVNGTVTVGGIGPAAKTQTYQNVDLGVSDLSYTTQFPFKLTVKTPGSGSIEIDGKAGPINQTDASLTPLAAKIDVKNVDLASTGLVDPSSGLAGLVSFSGDLASDGQQMTSTGAAKAEKIKLVANGSLSRVPVNIDYDAVYVLKSEAGAIKRGDIHIGKALAQLIGTFDNSGASASIRMKLNGAAMPVPDLEGVMPAVGIILPSGASLASGILNLNLTLSGPVNKLVIVGPVNLSNGKLAGFNLKQKLGALSSFTGLGNTSGSDTDIQTLSANLRIDPQGTQAENVNLVVPAFGTISGNAIVSASQQLNCKMVAKLTASGGAIGSLATIVSGAGSSKAITIPFTVKGTTSNPQFIPDVSGAVNNLVKGNLGNAGSAASSASGILGGVLKKKFPR